MGRQGPGARTHLLSPAMAAAAAVTGHFADVRTLMEELAMEAFRHLDAVAVPLPRPNIDTDQIIPARFLSRPREVDHGQFLFHDARAAARTARRTRTSR